MRPPDAVNGRAVLDAALTESEWQAQVTELAERLHWTWWHVRDSRRQNVTGLPDLILVRVAPLPARVVFAELKTMRGRLSGVQEVVINALKLAGVEAYVFRPSDWDSVVEILT